MLEDLSRKAIEAAIRKDWPKAIQLNLELLELDDAKIEILNRLAHAYAESGNIHKAIKTSQKALAIEPSNSIATKSLNKWIELLKLGTKIGNNNKTLERQNLAQIFLEEPGKTKIIPLRNVGHPSVLCTLSYGQEVCLVLRPHSVIVTTPMGDYIGKLPDDMASRLSKLIKMGNKYQTFIKSNDSLGVKVFVKADIYSFPAEKINYSAFTSPHLVSERKSGYLK